MIWIWIWFPGAPHGLRKPPKFREHLQRTYIFIKKCIKKRYFHENVPSHLSFAKEAKNMDNKWALHASPTKLLLFF